MPSFDVVSKVDMQEVKNAVEHVKKEITTRYDFKDSKSSVELNDLVITLMADDKMKLKAVQEIIRQKLAKRGVSLKSVTFNDEEPAGGDMIRQTILVKQGLSDEEQKKINKLIKSTKFKVNSQIQADQVRVSGKKRDDLQEVITYLRTEVKDLDLQFTNFRE
jgi:uncharacterized protein YajQ (UPF0234 family)